MKTYFTGKFSARRPITIIVGLVLTVVGVCFAVMWVPQMNKQLSLAQVMGTICALLFILVFLGGGCFLLYKIAKNQKTVLMITSDGVSYGTKLYRWEDITEIGIMEKYARRKDLYCETRLHPCTIELLLSRGLSSEQTAALFGALRSEVVPLHPHLCLSEDDAEKSHC